MVKKKTQPRSPLPLIMVLAGMVIVATVALLLAQRAAPPPAGSEQPQWIIRTGVPYPEVPRVSLTDARRAYDEQQALFLDVRPLESFTHSHIPNAVSLPLSELPGRLSELDPDQWIITYCT
jgi:hypothetical protein